MSAKRLELRRRPAPVFEHLAGRFHEISDDTGAVKARVRGSRDKIMDAVTKLMEECNDFVMFEKTWLLWCRLGEIADKSSGRVASRPVWFNEPLRKSANHI